MAKKSTGKNGPRKRRGKPPFKPTEAQEKVVRKHCLAGTDKETLADLLGITKPTLYKHFGQIIKETKAEAVANVAARLYKKALDGDKACMIFFLKTQGGWKETIRSETEHTIVEVPEINVTFTTDTEDTA